MTDDERFDRLVAQFEATGLTPRQADDEALRIMYPPPAPPAVRPARRAPRNKGLLERDWSRMSDPLAGRLRAALAGVTRAQPGIPLAEAKRLAVDRVAAEDARPQAPGVPA